MASIKNSLRNRILATGLFSMTLHAGDIVPANACSKVGKLYLSPLKSARALTHDSTPDGWSRKLLLSSRKTDYIDGMGGVGYSLKICNEDFAVFRKCLRMSLEPYFYYSWSGILGIESGYLIRQDVTYGELDMRCLSADLPILKSDSVSYEDHSGTYSIEIGVSDAATLVLQIVATCHLESPAGPADGSFDTANQFIAVNACRAQAPPTPGSGYLITIGGDIRVY